LHDIILLKGWIEVIDTAGSTSVLQLIKKMQEQNMTAGCKQEF
jgi:hypothetical protein